MIKNLTLIIAILTVSFVVYAQNNKLERPTTTATITRVYDGDTFVTDAGVTVRLVGINTPESCGSRRGCEPHGDTAKKFAQQWLTGQTVKLIPQTNKYDKYKRLLADVYLEDGTWVNAEMVKLGHAHVYSFPDNVLKIPELLTLENTARTTKTGLWKLPRWQPRHANNCCQQADIGNFILVEGTVNNIATVGKNTYLNFGEDWRTDFTILIKDRDRAKFPPLHTFQDKTIRVRGHAKPVNGVLISATHPEQLEVLD